MSHTRILVFGTFDIFHHGHMDFFQQARALAPDAHLIVSLARDVNVARIKGAQPYLSEQQRVDLVAAQSLVNEAVLGAVEDYIEHIVELRPDIIALGYDQHHYTQNLEQDLAQHGLLVQVVRLKPYHPEQFKSSIIKKQLGIATN